jgi:hypothetical protein
MTGWCALQPPTVKSIDGRMLTTVMDITYPKETANKTQHGDHHKKK